MESSLTHGERNAHHELVVIRLVIVPTIDQTASFGTVNFDTIIVLKLYHERTVSVDDESINH